MIQIKHDICEEVFFFNDAEQRVESGIIDGVRVFPTSVIKDESGKDVAERIKIFYQLTTGLNIPEEAAFSAKEECIGYYAALFGAM